MFLNQVKVTQIFDCKDLTEKWHNKFGVNNWRTNKITFANI
jgi:hypothetical protein